MNHADRQNEMIEYNRKLLKVLIKQWTDTEHQEITLDEALNMLGGLIAYTCNWEMSVAKENLLKWRKEVIAEGGEN